MDTNEYKALYKKVSSIVNEIDPGYYNGPADEYDYQVNGIIKLIDAGQQEDEGKLIELFFGERQDISEDEKDKIKLMAKELRSLKSIS